MRVHTFIYIYITNYAIDIVIFFSLSHSIFFFFFSISLLSFCYLFLEVAAHRCWSIVVVSFRLQVVEYFYYCAASGFLFSRLPAPPPSPLVSFHASTLRHTPHNPRPPSPYAYNDSVMPCHYAFCHPMTERENKRANFRRKINLETRNTNPFPILLSPLLIV